MALPKLALGSALIVVSTGRTDPEFVYLLVATIFATAAGALVTLGPLYRIGVWILLAMLGPMCISALMFGHWAVGLGILGFLGMMVSVALKQVGDLYEKLHEMRETVAERADRAEVAARTDWLTGLRNRLGLAELADELADTSVGCAYVDLDQFKEINDEFGHAAGDVAICHVARCLEAVAGPDHEGVTRAEPEANASTQLRGMSRNGVSRPGPGSRGSPSIDSPKMLC